MDAGQKRPSLASGDRVSKSADHQCCLVFYTHGRLCVSPLRLTLRRRRFDCASIVRRHVLQQPATNTPIPHGKSHPRPLLPFHISSRRNQDQSANNWTARPRSLFHPCFAVAGDRALANNNVSEKPAINKTSFCLFVVFKAQEQLEQHALGRDLFRARSFGRQAFRRRFPSLEIWL